MIRAQIWGTRGTIPAPGTATARYGGNTSCISVEDEDGTVLVLDAGSGVRLLGASLPATLKRVDILLTHLHLDHIMGLGFFAPLRWPHLEAHIWAPAGTALTLEARLMRYLSPPYFPLHINELSSRLTLHEVASSEFEIGRLKIASMPICHPGPTVGYRITTAGGSTIAYMPDHEPALGVPDFPLAAEWTSGYAVAEGADLLFHDAQYTDEEYAERVGWGHSTAKQALAFAKLSGAKHFAAFHYDPNRTDDEIDDMLSKARGDASYKMEISAAAEGEIFDLD